LLRANTNEFTPNQSKPSLQDLNKKVASQLAQILEKTSIQNQARVDLLHMNAPWIGGDDRLFNRQVAGFFEDSALVHVERDYLTIEGLIRTLKLADVAVAMRYHGHIFCMALGIPFLSIDYTGKSGKVHNLLQGIRYNKWTENWQAIDVTGGVKKIDALFKDHRHWSNCLLQETDRLIDGLQEVYTDVFDVTLY
jgi:polysaccharide pyruvyl transferase WcaK-like protein